MKKRIIGVVVAVVLIVSSIFTYRFFSGESNTVFADSFRDGYLITPTEVDSSGVKPNSSFIFKWEEDVEPVPISELEEGLTISPELPVIISETEEGLLIEPQEPLTKDTIYVFDYDGVTFAYRTEADFALIGTFPRNQTTNVPVNTGIEFVFNMEGADVEDYFEITPSVRGSFEQFGRVVVFVPKKLEEATVYTVTLKEGLELKGSNQALKGDYSFSFETEAKEGIEEPTGHVNFRQFMSEYAKSETPAIFWDFYDYEGKAPKESKVSVYAYQDVKDFVKDLNSFTAMPYWSWYGARANTVDTDGLKRVMNFDYEMVDDGSYPRSLTLPENLDQGYYLVQVEWGDVTAQTYIQVTDLGFYYSQAANGELFWTHDLASGNPLSGVNITEFVLPESTGEVDAKDIQEKSFSETSNNEGIIDLLGNRSKDSGETKTYLLEKDGMQTVCFTMNTNFYRSYYGNNANYWKYFKTDRSLYKPTDKVEFFGFLKNRYEDETLEDVTVEVTQGSFYYWEFLPYNMDSLSYVTEEVDVDNGFFKGNLTLPGLSQGGYELVVKSGDKVLARTYINVEEYVKPSYKLETSTDKKAVFADEPIEITVKSSFFEGTPVSFLDFEYNIGGLDYMNDYKTTDKNGEYVIRYTPKYMSGNQGQFYYYFSAYAQLPESGSIWSQQDFRVFLNDMDLSGEAKIKDELGTLSLDVHTITLDRINDETAENSGDFLDQPVEGKTIKGDIYRNEWIKTEVGEYYDFINKEVKKRYDYNLKTESLTGVNLTTDSEGHAELILDLPKEDSVYYTAKVTINDSDQRRIEQQFYFGNERDYEPGWGDYYRVELDQESYELNDQVQAEILYGDDALQGDFLFMAAQNGIIDYKTASSQSTSFNFDESYVPNADINGVYFNGRTYIQVGTAMARFDFSTREIDLEIVTDKDGYRPGDEIEVEITATYTDEQGNKQAVSGGTVNLGLIDEALLALSDQSINPLEELYQYVSSGIYQTYGSHAGEGFNFGGGFSGRGMVMETAAESEMMMDGADMNVSFTMAKSEDAVEESVAVRSEFKDTALFTTMTLDQEGKASVKVKLPDNVTSWRLTGAAISTELNAGSQVEDVKVSLPFFLNTSLSSTYLAGDQPYIGVTAYGSELTGNEAIDYVVTVYDTNDQAISSERVEGSVFERSNLPLGTLDRAGKYKVEVKGIMADGRGDGLELPIEVMNTYHEQLVTEYLNTEVGMTFNNNDNGDVTLTFTDQGRGKYLRSLYRLAYSGGKRVDQKYLAYIVQAYLNEQFEQDMKASEVQITDYMVNGGLAILPYAEADVETTVNMLGAVDNRISDVNLVLYLQNAWYDKKVSDKGAVLYGMVRLGEPVLEDLNRYAQIENLNDKDKFYTALAFAELGDKYMAKQLYFEVIEGKLAEFETVANIDAGNEAEDLEITAMAMLLTEKLGMDIHDKYYAHVADEYSKVVLINTWLYDYVMARMQDATIATGSVTYSYNGQEDTLEMDHGYARSITLPGLTMNQVSILDVEGDMQVAVTSKESIRLAVDNDDHLSVTRTYYNYQTNEQTNTFKEGDIIKVVLNWEVKDDAIDDYYRLTDYAPAGLKPINNPWQMGLRHEGGYMWYRDVDGQKVDFYLFKDKENHNYEPLVYYARITSIGEFKAEAPVIQGTRIMDSLYIGDQDTLYIKGE